jgi:hypothetical protein
LKFVLFLDKRNCQTVVKSQFSDVIGDFRFERFILIAPEMLILSVISCADSGKMLAFQFTNKNKQSRSHFRQ